MEPLLMYPLVEKLLADVPFGRFFASSHFWCPYAYTLWPKTSFSDRKILVDVPFRRFLVDFSLRLTWVPLVVYPLAADLLAVVPFGRFFA